MKSRILLYGALALVGAVLGFAVWTVRSLDADGSTAFEFIKADGPAVKDRAARNGRLPSSIAHTMEKRDHYDHIREIALPDLVRKTAEGGRFFIQFSPKWCGACWAMKNFVDDAYAVRKGPEWFYLDPDKCTKEEIRTYLDGIGEKKKPGIYPIAYLVESGKMERKLNGFHSSQLGRVLEEETAR